MSKLLENWNKIVAKRARETALILFPDNQLITFSELDERSSQSALQLQATLRSDHNKIVGLKVEDRLEWLVQFLAIIKSKAIVLPIDGTSTDEESQRLLHATGCNGFVNNDGFQLLSERRHPQLKRAAIQIFKVTSGSTSIPKTIAFTEDQMIADACNILTTKKINSKDVQFATIPLGHSYGLGSLVYPLLNAGVTIAFNSIPLPSIIEKELSLSMATVMPTIPGILKALARSESITLPDSLRLVISAASPLDQEVAIQFKQQHDLSIHNFYGSSETGGIAFDSSGDMLVKKGAVGRPLNNVEVSISKSGRLEVRSEAVFTFQNRNRSNVSGKDVGQFLISDYATIEENAIILKGRSNRIVKHNGKRMDLSQIEATIKEHKQIKDAYVDYDESRHRVICAIAGDIDTLSFSAFAAKQLAAWKRPKVAWITHDQLPQTDRGKPHRNKILKMIAEAGTALSY